MGGPHETGRILEPRNLLKPQTCGERICPPPGEGVFAYFCRREKVWRLAVREPPVLLLAFQKTNENRLTIRCSQIEKLNLRSAKKTNPT